MAKYSYEFKLEIVQAYLRGEGSIHYLAQKYGMPGDAPLKRWIREYQELGSESLLRSREKKQYSFEFKMHVVELYLTTELSYLELAIQVGMKNSTTVEVVSRPCGHDRKDGDETWIKRRFPRNLQRNCRTRKQNI